MSDDQPLKSAYDLAMERLRAKDRDSGLEESRPLTDDQKAEIARLRQEAKAKLAELEILHRKELAALADPGKRLEAEEKYRIDRTRVEDRLETAVARIKRGE